MDNDFKFRYVNESVGVFVLVVMIVTSVTIFFMGRTQRWIQPETSINVVLPHEGSFGLKQGADVQVLGTTVGKVESIYIDENDKMHAKVRIQSDFSRFVRVDSIAWIRKQFGVAGDSYLDITRGEGDLLPLERGFIVATADRAPTDTLQEAIDEIQGEFIPLIQDFRSGVNEWSKLAKDIRSRETGLMGMIDQGSEFFESIERQEGALGKLINDPEWADDIENTLMSLTNLTNNMEIAAANFRQASDSTIELTEGINNEVRELEGIAMSTKELVQEVSATVKDIRSATNNVGEFVDSLDESAVALPTVLQQSNEALRDIELLVEALQRHWLIRKYVDEKPQSNRISPTDSVLIGGQP